jgi:hypothetical protein
MTRKGSRSNKRDKILVDRVTGDQPLPANILHVPPRLPDAPARIDRRPRVSDDPRDIAAVRERWQQDIDARYTAALAAIRTDAYFLLEHQDVFLQLRDRAVVDMKAILAREPGALVKVRAARVLCDLGDPTGEQILLDSLQSRSTALCKAALLMLREWDLHVDLASSERARRVLTLLDHRDPDVVRAAADLCVWKKVPGAQERLVAVLEAGRAQNPEQSALGLARIATTPEAVQALLAHLFHDRPDDHYQGYHFQLERLLRHPDPRISEPVRKALHAYARKWTAKLRHQQHIVNDLAETADAEAIPVLEKIRDGARDPVSRLYALSALARLQPRQAVDLVLDFMAREGPDSMSIDILPEHVRKTDVGRILKAVVPPQGELNGAVVRLLLRLGDRGQQVVASRLTEVEPEARMEAVWALQGLNVRGALAELHAAGILPQSPDEVLAEMAQARSHPHPLLGSWFEEDPVGEDSPTTVLQALGTAGLVTTFDTETGTVPCDHDHLILDFAEGTAGRFRPECPVQVWHQEHDEDFDAPYTVAFLHNGRVYVFGAENFGDYYDVEAVVNALNLALQHAGRPERFLGIEGMGQCAYYVFADPDAFLPLAARYGIPVSADHAGPMRAGRAFEEQMFSQLDRDEEE